MNRPGDGVSWLARLPARLAGRQKARWPSDGAAWVARLHTRRLSWGERRALRRWLGASSEHARDLLRAETVWRLSGALGREEEVVAELSRIPLQDSADASAHRLAVWRWAVAGVAVGVVAGVVWLALASRSQWFETAPGEQRVVTLADGSTVAINTASRVSVEFDEKQRLIVLKQGEALFQVAPDGARPFVVRAGAGSVRAVGTRFNVLLDAGAMTVSVFEGRVEVASSSGSGVVERRLGAGESAALERSGRLVAADPERASAERIVAWREGKLRFDEWSVARAVQEHNRYAAKPIRVATGDLGGQLVSGTFRIGDTPALLEALEHLLDVETIDTGDAWLLENRSQER